MNCRAIQFGWESVENPGDPAPGGGVHQKEPDCERTFPNFGVPFRHDYLRVVAEAKNGYGLSDNEEMASPLLTGVHPAEYAAIGIADEQG